MGVQGLWGILKPASEVRSLTHIAVQDGFILNRNGRRGYRLGIDASIWLFHIENGKEGENPLLRTFYFRCAKLMQTTFLPLFVFDGPLRPDVKRGKKISKIPNKLIPAIQKVIDAFGFEWRVAPGEAEAELAYLNTIGIIDGILSDDVDNFIFGAEVVIRNPSNNLSGNKTDPALNSDGKDDKNHTRVYRLKDITNHSDIQLTRGGLILVGLLHGGDYDQGGLERCGLKIAHGLAKCGFGDSLLEAALTMSKEELKDYLFAWRDAVRLELRTNSKGHIGRKQGALAKTVTEAFPDLDVLLSYVRPITSESMNRADRYLDLTWDKEPDLAKLSEICEFYFEWGYKEAIIKRFRTVMWHSIVLRILRRGVLEKEEMRRKQVPATPGKNALARVAVDVSGTPSKMIASRFSSLKLSSPAKVYISGSEDEEEDETKLIVDIKGSRSHAYTDGLLEYRLEINPKQLVEMTESGITGIRQAPGEDEWAYAQDNSDEDEDDEGGKKGKKVKGPVDPLSHLRVWMPACMVEIVEPRMVDKYEAAQDLKLQKKVKAAQRKAEGVSPKKAGGGKKATKAQTKSPADERDPFLDEHSEESEHENVRPKTKAKPKPKGRSKKDDVLPTLAARTKPAADDSESEVAEPPKLMSVQPKGRPKIRDLTKKTTVVATSITTNGYSDASKPTTTTQTKTRAPPRAEAPLVASTSSLQTTTTIRSSKHVARNKPVIELTDSDGEYPTWLQGNASKQPQPTNSLLSSPSKRKPARNSPSPDMSDPANRSPRKKAAIHSRKAVRAPSPSPIKPTQHRALGGSQPGSDSDELPDTFLPPLILAQARAKAAKAAAAETSTQKTTIPITQPRRKALATNPEDIIDLT